MVRNNQGFTLIEVLTVVMIIGILATVALPKLTGVKDKSYLAILKTDLKNFVIAQEHYFANNNKYGTRTELDASGLFSATSSVTLNSSDGNGSGFSGEATHAKLGTAPGETCGVYVGNATPPDASLTEGAPGCY